MWSDSQVYENIRNEKTVGVINEDPWQEFRKLPSPWPYFCGYTGYESHITAIYKILSAWKTRKSVIWAPTVMPQKARERRQDLLWSCSGSRSSWRLYTDDTGRIPDFTQTVMAHPKVPYPGNGRDRSRKNCIQLGQSGYRSGPGQCPCVYRRKCGYSFCISSIIT